MNDGWVYENMQAIMNAIGIASVVGVAAIFVIYFFVQRKVRKNKSMK